MDSFDYFVTVAGILSVLFFVSTLTYHFTYGRKKEAKIRDSNEKLYSASRKREEEREKELLDHARLLSEEWLKEENLKPKYKVVIGFKNNSNQETSVFEPEVTWISHMFWKETSLTCAKNFIDSVFSQGRYFNEELNIYTPITSIDYIRAVEVKPEGSNSQ